MKKIAYLLLATMMAACGNENDFPEIIPDKPEPPQPSTGVTDGGTALFGEYEGRPLELTGAFGTADLATFDISPDMSPAAETETIVSAPEAGYEDFVENYGYDELTGETDNAVKTLKFTYVNGLVQGQYFTKKGNLKATFTSSRTVVDDDDPTVVEAYVEIKGQHVTVKALKKFNYLLTGTGKEGSCFKLYSDKKFMITLDNVSLHNDRGAAINLQKSFNIDEENKYKGKRAYLIVKGTNTLKDSPLGGYAKTSHPNSGEEEDEKGVIFSEGKLLVSGDGTLNVVAQGKHGIVSDDYVYMHAGPSVSITSAPGYDAVNTNDGIIVAGGTHNYAIGGADAKGLNSDSTITVTGGRVTITDLAASAAAPTTALTGVNAPRVIVEGGELLVKTEGTAVDARDVFVMNGGTARLIGGSNDDVAQTASKPKALEAREIYINGGMLTMRGANTMDSDNRITIVGGMVEAYATNNAIRAARNIQVKGGAVYALSTKGAAMVSDGIIGIAGGVVYGNAASNTMAGIDCKNNLFDIDGGVVIAIGGSNSSPTLTDSGQHSIEATVVSDAIANGTAATLNGVVDANGTCLAAFKATNSDGVKQKTLLFSAPSLSAEGDYLISTGGKAEPTASGLSFHNVYVNGVTLTGAAPFTAE